jgi:death-on-curing protein
MSEPIDFLDLQDLIEIGNSLISDFRIRDEGLLESAAMRPQTTIYGEDAYPTFEEKVASLIHSLARNHALIDGNKRIAWSAGRIFCLMNGRDLNMPIDDAEKMILDIAKGVIDVADIAVLLKRSIK